MARRNTQDIPPNLNAGIGESDFDPNNRPNLNPGDNTIQEALAANPVEETILNGVAYELSEDAQNGLLQEQELPPTESAPPPNPVVERALEEDLNEHFTDHSDHYRERQEMELTHVQYTARKLRQQINKLEAQYTDLMLKGGMIQRGLAYKEGSN